MTDWVLDEDALQAAHERALNEARERLRTSVDKALDELGITGPVRREVYHSRALQLAMPIAREVYGRDCEQLRKLASAPSIVRH